MAVRERIEVPEWSRWTFVEEARFTERDVGLFALPSGQNLALLDRTRFVGTVREVDGRVEDRFIDRTAIEAAVGHPIRPVRLADAGDPQGAGLHGDELGVFRPRLAREGVRADP